MIVVPCIFCGSQAAVTREHVLPQWAGSLPPGEGPFIIKRISDAGEVIEHHAKGVDIVARVVCGPCNSGWMAELEAAAQPLLKPMINGEPRSLMPGEQHTVARRAVKIAFMFLYPTRPPTRMHSALPGPTHRLLGQVEGDVGYRAGGASAWRNSAAARVACH